MRARAHAVKEGFQACASRYRIGSNDRSVFPTGVGCFANWGRLSARLPTKTRAFLSRPRVAASRARLRPSRGASNDAAQRSTVSREERECANDSFRRIWRTRLVPSRKMTFVRDRSVGPLYPWVRLKAGLQPNRINTDRIVWTFDLRSRGTSLFDRARVAKKSQSRGISMASKAFQAPPWTRITIEGDPEISRRALCLRIITAFTVSLIWKSTLPSEIRAFEYRSCDRRHAAAFSSSHKHDRFAPIRQTTCRSSDNTFRSNPSVKSPRCRWCTATNHRPGSGLRAPGALSCAQEQRADSVRRSSPVPFSHGIAPSSSRAIDRPIDPSKVANLSRMRRGWRHQSSRTQFRTERKRVGTKRSPERRVPLSSLLFSSFLLLRDANAILNSHRTTRRLGPENDWREWRATRSGPHHSAILLPDRERGRWRGGIARCVQRSPLLISHTFEFPRWYDPFSKSARSCEILRTEKLHVTRIRKARTQWSIFSQCELYKWRSNAWMVSSMSAYVWNFCVGNMKKRAYGFACLTRSGTVTRCIC